MQHECDAAMLGPVLYRTNNSSTCTLYVLASLSESKVQDNSPSCNSFKYPQNLKSKGIVSFFTGRTKTK